MRGGTSMEWRFNSIEPYIVSQGNIYDLFESIYFKLICRNSGKYFMRSNYS